ncbi:MAG TPA: hypothetical protein VFQ43_07485 [Nitrososphaera sp.]|nr:hypothetical protein [Nitrososphaera sp.]
MATRAKKRSRQDPSHSAKQLINGPAVSMCPGDVLRIQLFHTRAKPFSTLLLRADRCDDRHQILFGTSVSESADLSKALNRGAKLAVAYHLVRENLRIVGVLRASYVDA